jgi:hypothetical protein
MIAIYEHIKLHIKKLINIIEELAEDATSSR